MLLRNIFILLAVSTTASARAFYDSSGFKNITHSTKTDFIAQACLSPAFNDSTQNVAASNATGFYKDWTINELPRLLDAGYRNEIVAAGYDLFGIENLDCSYSEGHCENMPNCQDIAVHMGLEREVNNSEDLVEELRKRYFVSIILRHEIQSAYLLWNVFALVKDNLEDVTDQIALDFSQQPEKDAVRRCELEKAVIDATWSILATTLSLATSYMGTAIAGAVEGGIAMGALKRGAQNNFSKFWKGADPVLNSGADKKFKDFVPAKGQIIGGLISSAGFVASTLVSKGYDLAQHKSTSESEWAKISTQIDGSRCGDFLGGFQDQNEDVRKGLNKYVVKWMNDMKAGADQQNEEKFNGVDNKPGEPSRLATILESKPLWPLNLELRDRLRSTLQTKLRDRLTKNLIAVVLRARQCYIKCLQLDPGKGVDDPQGIRLDDQSNPSPLWFHELTFYPERVLAKEKRTLMETDYVEELNPESLKKVEYELYTEGKESSITPTLQCQFQCLKQNIHGNSYFPASVVDNFGKWQEPKLEAQELLTEAVVANLYNIHGSESRLIPGLNQQVQGFELPVCISSNLCLEDQYGRSPNERCTPWPEQFFPLLCGDYRASQTSKFISDMPITPKDGPHNMKDHNKFWYHSFRRSISKYQDTPFTFTMVLCEVGRAIQWQDPIKLGNHEKEVCDEIQEQTKYMSELEATLFLCNGDNNRLEKKMWDWNSIHWSPWKACWKYRDNRAPLGLSLHRFSHIEEDYKRQRDAWMAGSKNIKDLKPFKWNQSPQLTHLGALGAVATEEEMKRSADFPPTLVGLNYSQNPNEEFFVKVPMQ